MLVEDLIAILQTKDPKHHVVQNVEGEYYGMKEVKDLSVTMTNKHGKIIYDENKADDTPKNAILIW